MWSKVDKEEWGVEMCVQSRKTVDIPLERQTRKPNIHCYMNWIMNK
jgi:hypothetical protein